MASAFNPMVSPYIDAKVINRDLQPLDQLDGGGPTLGTRGQDCVPCVSGTGGGALVVELGGWGGVTYVGRLGGGVLVLGLGGDRRCPLCWWLGGGSWS